MPKSLWAKFFILLLAVSLVGLSAALYMRQMMLADFDAYLDGERLDRVYNVTANLEGSHERNGGWVREDISRIAANALMLGMLVRVRGPGGAVIMDTRQALEDLGPLMTRRVLSLAGEEPLNDERPYIPYPLFLAGEHIGSLEVKALSRERGKLFVRRSNRFLAISFILMGGLAFLTSLLVSRRLTLPLKRLVDQTRAIRKGELAARTEVTGLDEIGGLARAFNEMADDLQLQESLRRKLIANVAHELRTPLGAMRGELEGMMDGVLPTNEAQLRSLYEETGRLRAMLDGIDDLTQAQASSLTLVKQEVDLPAFMANIAERFRARAGEKDVRVVSAVEESTTAWADPDRLSQIVINLLDNAVRAVPDRGRVELAGGRDGGRTWIEVRDTGPGIPAEELPRIFERFYSGAEGGLGLGLSIVRELVHAHGGAVEVESETGKGTKVRVVLPGR